MKITGKRIVLRDKKRDSDDEDLFRWLNLEEWNYYDEPDKLFQRISREEFERRLEERRRKPKHPPPGSHTWHIDTIEGQHIGWVNYYQLDRQAGQAFVGIVFPEKETWGKGYGTEALSLLIGYLFREMGLKEIKTATWTGNNRMIRCAEKCGFKERARIPHRAEFSVRGEPLERIEFSISRSEWLACKSVKHPLSELIWRSTMKKDPYRRIAKLYDPLFQPMNAGLTAIGLKMFPPAEGMSVLDVGCGTGTQLARYRKAGCEVFGIDPSPAMMNAARKKLGDGAELHLGDAADMPFVDETFDLVTATLVLHEMSPAVRDGVINEIKRVLKGNGRILFTDFHPGPFRFPKGWFTKVFITISEIGAGREHFRNYRHFMAGKELPSLVARHGLVIEQQKIVSGGNMGLFLLHT